MRTILAATYITGLVISEGLRLPQRFRRSSSSRKNSKPVGSRRIAEVIVLAAIAGGIWILPLLYISTEWFSGFDYFLPNWIAWPGVGVFMAGILLRWAAQSALGSSWSPTLETGSHQQLVTSGVYQWIRHPLYSSLILWAIVQPILLQNSVAGFSGAVAVALIWLVRVPEEERMMCERFGDAYSEYMRRTGKVIPRLR